MAKRVQGGFHIVDFNLVRVCDVGHSNHSNMEFTQKKGRLENREILRRSR